MDRKKMTNGLEEFYLFKDLKGEATDTEESASCKAFADYLLSRF
jgi:hypothetical protein